MKRLVYLLLTLILFMPISMMANDPIQVNIHGLNDDMEENVRANLSLLQEYNDEIVSHRLQHYQQLAEEEIRLALEPFGYYSPTINTQFDHQEGKWTATFQVSLGPPTRLHDLHLTVGGEGIDELGVKPLLALFPLKSGDIFVHKLYDKGKKALLAAAIQRGYLNAELTEHRVEVYPTYHSAEVFLTLDTGAKHFFGPVTYATTELCPDFLNRYLSFVPGEQYVPEKMMILQSQLSQSDYFSSVNVKAQPSPDSTTVPILVELEDAKPNHYTIGAGYGTDTGPRGKVKWTRRRVNSFGHRISAQAQVAEIYRKVQADYIIPGKRPQTDHIKLRGGFYEDEFTEKTSQIYEAGILEERKIESWKRRLSLNYHHERFHAFATNEKVQSKLIQPGIHFTQIRSDNPTNPTRGRKIELHLRGAVDAYFNGDHFFQTYLQMKWLHAFNPMTKALIRLEGGFTIPKDIENIPLSQRFFAGGDLSLRGYGYRSLPSEIDKDGIRHPVGGLYLGIGSLEISRTIKKPIALFTFFDAGNAFRKYGNEVAMGTGLGIEWQTRLGPIKFAVAKPLTKDSSAWRLHVTFGPEL